MQRMEELNKLMEDILQLLQDNIIPVIIILAIILYIVYSYIRHLMDPNTKNIRKVWSSVQKNATKLTSNFYGTVGDMDGPGFNFNGDLYQIDSTTYNEIIETEIQTYLTEKEELEIFEKNVALSEEQKIVIHEDEKGKYIYQIYRVPEKRKSITALAMMPDKAGGEIVAIRRTGLRETETIISETEQTPLISLDPRIQHTQLKLAIWGMAVYEIIVIYMMLTNTDASLLFSNSSWPWYVLLFVIYIMKNRVDQQKVGYKVLYRGSMLGEESFRLKNLENDALTITIPVYQVELHFHMAIPTKNVLKGIGKEEIYDSVLKNLERRNSMLSAENSSLRSRLEQSNEILSHKDEQLVEARNEHLKSFNDGFLSGYQRYHVKNEDEAPYPIQKSGVDTLAWFKESKLIIIALIVIGAIYFLFQGLGEAISKMNVKGGGSLDIFTPNMLLGMGLVIFAILILAKMLPSKL